MSYDAMRLAEIGDTVELGDALEVIVAAPGGSVAIAFAPRSPDSYPADWRIPCEPAALLWSPSWRALVVILGGERLAGREPFDERSEAARARAEFHDAPARNAYFILPPPLPGGPWRFLGPGLRTDYRSDKWGRRGEEYKHGHGAGVGVFLRGNFAAGILAVSGGKLDVTPAGIVG